MNNKTKNKICYTVLISLLMISLGINFVFYNRILILQDFILGLNPWVSVEQFDLMKAEIDRLENQRYEIVPKGE